MIRRQLLPALVMVIVFTVITGGLYPLLVTGIAQGAFGDQANGSLVERNGQVVGSALIGQPFSSPDYFHPRPSAAGYAPGPGYSFGSNFGPTNETFLDGVDGLVRDYREMNGLEPDAPVPVDAVTSSGSGLDPHISVANARLQVARVADNRGLAVDQVMELVEEHTEGRDLGFLGEPGVNVLLLNLALDDLAR